MYLGVKFLFVLTPSPCGHLPYVLLCKHRGGGCKMPQDIEEAVKGKSTIKLLLCVVLAIGAVSSGRRG